MWQAFCEALKNYGRNGTWFMSAVLAMLIAGLFWDHGGHVGLLVLMTVCVARVAAILRDMRLPTGKAPEFPPLSQNEWEAARSKLLKCRNSKSS